MCVQYIGEYLVHHGVFSTSGGYHEYIGGGYHEYIGDIMSMITKNDYDIEILSMYFNIDYFRY